MAGPSSRAFIPGRPRSAQDPTPRCSWWASLKWRPGARRSGDPTRSSTNASTDRSRPPVDRGNGHQRGSRNWGRPRVISRRVLGWSPAGRSSDGTSARIAARTFGGAPKSQSRGPREMATLDLTDERSRDVLRRKRGRRTYLEVARLVAPLVDLEDSDLALGDCTPDEDPARISRRISRRPCPVRGATPFIAVPTWVLGSGPSATSATRPAAGSSLRCTSGSSQTTSALSAAPPS